MILAVPIGLIFINFYKYGAFDSLIQKCEAADQRAQRVPQWGGIRDEGGFFRFGVSPKDFL